MYVCIHRKRGQYSAAQLSHYVLRTNWKKFKVSSLTEHVNRLLRQKRRLYHAWMEKKCI